jgi:4-hydroxy-tetrahydrodipicolinate synthase
VSFQPTGIITALVTPFDRDGELDLAALRRIASWQLGAGVQGLAVVAGSGEYVCLTQDERRKVIDTVLAEVQGNLPVIAGILAPATREAVDLARYSMHAGASAILVLPPYYIRPSLDGLVAHFSSIAERADLPIIAYNNPSRVGMNMDLEILHRLAEIDRVIGVKECERDLGRVALKILQLGDRLAILTGEDDLAFPSLLLGARGGILTVSNVLPKSFLELYEAVQRGDVTLARQIHFNLLPLIDVLYTANHPGPVKQAMAMIGQPVGAARAPLQGMTDAQARKAKQILQSGEIAPSQG